MENKSYSTNGLIVSLMPWLILFALATWGFFMGINWFGVHYGIDAFMLTLYLPFFLAGPLVFLLFAVCIAYQSRFLQNYYKNQKMLSKIINVFFTSLPINVILGMHFRVFEEGIVLSVISLLINFIMIMWPIFFSSTLSFKIKTT